MLTNYNKSQALLSRDSSSRIGTNASHLPTSQVSPDYKWQCQQEVHTLQLWGISLVSSLASPVLLLFIAPKMSAVFTIGFYPES